MNNSESWRVAGYSVRGVSHEQVGTPCQDANAWRALDGGWLVIAVSDGAGSAPLADVGAKVAVQEAVEQSTELIKDLAKSHTCDGSVDWHEFLEKVVNSTITAVLNEARSRHCAAQDLACTLLCLVLGPSTAAALQIGDGGIVVTSDSGSIELLTRPDSGEYINETVFLVSSGAFQTCQFAIRHENVRSAAVFSDGLQLLALNYPSWEPFAPFFKPFFDLNNKKSADSAQSELSTFLACPRVRQRTSDDVTLVVASHLAENMNAGGL
jgi:hypothetical protein